MYVCMYVRNNALARSARAFAFRRREFEVKKKRSTGWNSESQKIKEQGKKTKNRPKKEKV